jgi:hydrogenase maturation protein HypF
MSLQTRAHIDIRGAVQGVGFRPFVFRLAAELCLAGWVSNSTDGVSIEVEGPKEQLDEFLIRLGREHPERASIHGLEVAFLDPAGFAGFQIRPSETRGKKRALVLPDIATCMECLRDTFDPSNRRYHYPFTNCTNCGPRFTIIEALPYDRANTTMRGFTMCPRCQSEYNNPLNRRFHAQPNACPDCGPQVEFWNSDGTPIAERDDAIRRAAEALKDGLVVAVKGLGGFHLMADATSEQALRLLRTRKKREEKPFALMAPTIAHAREMCAIDSRA